ncbi:hypothetical protein OY671_007073, partial [Metschnikowia pulcherrima]
MRDHISRRPRSLGARGADVPGRLVRVSSTRHAEEGLMNRVTRSAPRRRVAAAGAAGALVLALGVGLAPTASSAPSDDDVRAAGEAADGASRDVATVERE